ncbi:glycoprotein [Guadeloupe mosquito phasivirus]|uniref:Glycoprotein n=1 Tax=Guadeloupe mosquito phasivirus TaxID=2607734 RepID=A0A5C1K416_9VIRU|nr:glycoprotein [Guadeloupe mosquito phasivirus]QEM39250.1 glycoprotein [Guadeloupe mosquito phasivirus]
MKSGFLKKPKGTLELMIQHTLITEQDEQSEVKHAESVHQPRVIPAITNGGEAEYLAMGSTTQEIDPELCKTYEVVKGLIQQSKHRRNDLIKLARKVYNYEGHTTITAIAKFYVEYTKQHYHERVNVMGLAKLLGDFASLVSETYFLEEAFAKNADLCGIRMEKVRRKRRNVMQSMIGSGSCTRRFGTWDPIIKDLKFLSKVPFHQSIRVESLLRLGKCEDAQTAWVGVIESGSYRSAISASFKEGTQACVKMAICPAGLTYEGTNCVEGKSSDEFSNIEGFELSVVSGRVKLEELPMELKTLSRSYCSIQGKTVITGKSCEKPIRTTSKFTLYSISGQWLFTDKDVLIAHGQDTSNICFYNCNEGCSAGCLQCKGDEAYESIFGSWPDSACQCSYCVNCSDIYMQVDGAKIGVDAIMHAQWEITIPIENEPVMECSGCKASCKGRDISIERDASFDVIHVCIYESCYPVENDEPDFTYHIPIKHLHITEFVIMFFRSDGLGRHSQTVACLDSHVCTSIHCDICPERFANPHCFKFINWVILTLMATSLILIIPIICLLYRTSKVVLAILLLPAGLLLKLFRVLFRKCSRKSLILANSASARVNQFVNEEDQPVIRLNNRPPLRAGLAIILLWLSSCALGCENVISVDSKVLECLPSFGGEIKCSINTIVDVRLSSIGEESCINVNDQTGSVVHVIKLKTTSIRQKCAKSILYYTCDGDFKLLNSFRCRDAGECIDDTCEKVKPKGPAPIPSTDNDKAGFHGCSRVTGFWGKGCFLANQACQFYKIELQNKNRRVFEISKCSEWYWEIKVNVTISSKDGVREQELKLDTTLPQKTIIGLCQLQSVSSPTNTNINKCFARRLSSGMRTAMLECSDRSVPEIGKVGGIQCAAPTLAEQASKSCLLDSNAVQIVVQDDNVVFVNRFINVSEAWQGNLLPRNWTGSVISEEPNGQIFLHYVDSAAYTLRVKMQDYKISYTVVKPKCEAHFRNLRGCSNCGPGAILEAEVTIDKAIRTPVRVVCPSANAPGIQLAMSTKPVTLFKMAFLKSEIDEKCSVECAGNMVQIEVKGTLVSSIAINGQPDNKFLIGKGSDFILSFPWRNFGILRYFYILIGVLIVLPVVVGGFFCLSSLCKIATMKLFKRRKFRRGGH